MSHLSVWCYCWPQGPACLITLSFGSHHCTTLPQKYRSCSLSTLNNNTNINYHQSPRTLCTTTTITGATQHPGAGCGPKGHRCNPLSAQLGPCAGTRHVTPRHGVLRHQKPIVSSLPGRVGPVARGWGEF